MVEFITGLIEQLGYFGIALLMFIETVIPPIPSEIMMPLAASSPGASRCGGGRRG